MTPEAPFPGKHVIIDEIEGFAIRDTQHRGCEPCIFRPISCHPVGCSDHYFVPLLDYITHRLTDEPPKEKPVDRLPGQTSRV